MDREALWACSGTGREPRNPVWSWDGITDEAQSLFRKSAARSDRRLACRLPVATGGSPVVAGAGKPTGEPPVATMTPTFGTDSERVQMTSQEEAFLPRPTRTDHSVAAQSKLKIQSTTWQPLACGCSGWRRCRRGRYSPVTGSSQEESRCCSRQPESSSASARIRYSPASCDW